MRIITILAMLCLFSSVYAQTDSTTIKLSNYKDLFIKGLISDKEYEELKRKELRLGTVQAETPIIKPDTIKRVGFNVALSPVYAYTLSVSGLEPDLLSSGDYVPTSIHHGGIHIGMGPSFYRRHKANVVIGIEGAKRFILYPIYLQYTYNFMSGTFAPVGSLGGGFVGTRYASYNVYKYSYGGLVCADFGLAITKRKFSFNIASGYRLLANSYGWYVIGGSGNKIGWERGMVLTHQFTLRAAFIFY